MSGGNSTEIIHHTPPALSMQSLTTSDDLETSGINEKSHATHESGMDTAYSYWCWKRANGQSSHARYWTVSQSIIVDASPDELGQLVEDESRMYGSVSTRVYITYAKAATSFLAFMAVFMYITRQAVRIGSDFWLAEWSEQSLLAELHAQNMLNNNTTNSTTVSYMQYRSIQNW